jgi:hypothetical protein
MEAEEVYEGTIIRWEILEGSLGFAERRVEFGSGKV